MNALETSKFFKSPEWLMMTTRQNEPILADKELVDEDSLIQERLSRLPSNVTTWTPDENGYYDTSDRYFKLWNTPLSKTSGTNLNDGDEAIAWMRYLKGDTGALNELDNKRRGNLTNVGNYVSNNWMQELLKANEKEEKERLKAEEKKQKELENALKQQNYDNTLKSLLNDPAKSLAELEAAIGQSEEGVALADVNSLLKQKMKYNDEYNRLLRKTNKDIKNEDEMTQLQIEVNESSLPAAYKSSLMTNLNNRVTTSQEYNKQSRAANMNYEISRQTDKRKERDDARDLKQKAEEAVKNNVRPSMMPEDLLKEVNKKYTWTANKTWEKRQ